MNEPIDPFNINNNGNNNLNNGSNINSNSAETEVFDINNNYYQTSNNQTTTDNTNVSSIQNNNQAAVIPTIPIPEGNPNSTPTQTFNNMQNTNSNIQNTYNNDDYAYMEQDLLDGFIGKNADKIMSRNYNIAAFFFGPVYLFYRKMFLYALILVIITIIVSALNLWKFTILLNVVLLFVANKLYINYAKKKIERIKKNNANIDYYQLRNILGRKGGTSVGYVFLGIILVFLVLFVASIVMGASSLVYLFSNIGIPSSFNSNNEFDGSFVYDNANDVLSYKFPDNFKVNDNWAVYEIERTNTKFFTECQIHISKLLNYNDLNKLINGMENYYHTKSTQNTVNGINWTNIIYDNIGENYVYLMEYNGAIYMYEFTIQSDADKNFCEPKVTEVLNSIRIK